MRRKKKRDPLERIVLKVPGFFTLTELSWFLQMRKESIKHWFGWYGKEKWRIKSFPEPERRGRWLVFPVSRIEQFLGIKIADWRNEVRIVEPLLTLKNISSLTGRAVVTIRSWIRQKDLKAIRAGRLNLRVEKHELERFLSYKYDYRVFDKGYLFTKEST